MRKLPIPEVISKYWAFRGGLDQVSPSIAVPPGVLRSSINVEVGVNGAYKTTQGYERYDGRTRPSDAVYDILTCTITGSPVTGNTVTGATSGATGVIIASTSTQLILTKVVGTFQSGETINGSGATVTATSTTSRNGASTAALNASYLNLAADEYRDDIAVVPGEGDILGVHKFGGAVYAIRNAVGGATAAMYKSSTSGWTAVSLGRELAFTAGQSQLVVGATITGATSGATAVIRRIVVTSGALGSSNGVGFIYFASQTGTFQAENIQVGGVNRGTIAGNSTAITLSPSGRYEFVTHNFGGSAGADRMYAASGVHKAFEFDGTYFAFVSTGMTTDTPTHIAVHKNQLFLAFANSVQHSSIGDPLTWSAVLGAAEINIGDTVTGFQKVPGSSDTGALILYARNSTHILYGSASSGADAWRMVTLSPDVGALEWTIQWLGQGICLDDRGINLTSTSQAFGNFAGANVGQQVQPYLVSLRNNAVASCIVREKNQYRLFFEAGSALYVTFIGNKPAGFMPVTLTDAVTCIASLEDTSGEEEIYFGSDTGYVYQMDKGTSHDGGAIEWNCELAFNHFGSPLLLKHFRKAVVEVSGEGYAEFSMSYSVGYGTSDLPQDVSTSITTNLSEARWDSVNWDQFYWDGQTLIPSEADLDGTAENISLSFAGSSDQFSSITLNGAIVAFSPRRNKR